MNIDEQNHVSSELEHCICGGKTGKHTITYSIPEASSRPFIILKYKESPVVHSTYIYTDPLCSFTLY